jgi:hypothetical protein
VTLSTAVSVRDAVPVRELFDWCRHLLGVPASAPAQERDYGDGVRSIGNPAGIGAPALLRIHYLDDTARTVVPRPRDPDAVGWAWQSNVAFVTGQRWRGANGAGCQDLHAWLLSTLGGWLDERAAYWRWAHNLTARRTWRDRFDGVAAFGNPVHGAPPW